MLTKTIKGRIKNVVTVLAIPIIIYLLFLITSGGRFGNYNSIMLNFKLTALSVLIALALAPNMSMHMWDFSVGAIITTACILGVKLSQVTGTGMLGIVLFTIVFSLVMATLNGILYNLMKVPSIVLTVGMAMIYEAVPRVLKLSRVSMKLTQSYLARSPYIFIVFFIMIVIFYIIFTHTEFGHQIKAIGANQTIANSAGISLSNVKFKSFVLGGLFAGVAAVVFASKMMILSPMASFGSVSLIFDAFNGIFIAFFLQRYCNLTIAIIIGTLSMTMLNSGLVAVGLQTTARDITNGLFLLVVLAIASNQGKITEYRRRKKIASNANNVQS